MIDPEKILQLNPEPTASGLDTELPSDVEPQEAPQESEPKVAETRTEPEPKPDDSMVPLSALHEARQQAKEAREAADTLKSEMESREYRMAQYVKEQFDKINQAQQPREQAPDPNEDPIAALQYQNQKLQERLQAIEAGNQQTAQRQAQGEQQQALQQQLGASAQAFQAQHPDYMGAVAHIRNNAATMLQMQGYSPEQVNQEIINWELRFGASQILARKDPAERFYELAKSLGYQGEVQPEPESQPEPSKDENLERIEKGQKQAGLGDGGAVPAPAEAEEGDFPILKQAMREMGLV